MEKFKPGDIVYLQRQITQDDWQLNEIGSIDVTFSINDKLIINGVSKHTIRLIGHDRGWYPKEVFDFNPVNTLKHELNKLKETILTKKIRVTKEERRRFERLCLKLEIPVHEEGFIKLSNKLFGEESESGIHGSALIYFETDKNTDIDFKDLIEPFKKFRDEIL